MPGRAIGHGDGAHVERRRADPHSRGLLSAGQGLSPTNAAPTKQGTAQHENTVRGGAFAHTRTEKGQPPFVHRPRVERPPVERRSPATRKETTIKIAQTIRNSIAITIAAALGVLTLIPADATAEEVAVMRHTTKPLPGYGTLTLEIWNDGTDVQVIGLDAEGRIVLAREGTMSAEPTFEGTGAIEGTLPAEQLTFGQRRNARARTLRNAQLRTRDRDDGGVDRARINNGHRRRGRRKHDHGESVPEHRRRRRTRARADRCARRARRQQSLQMATAPHRGPRGPGDVMAFERSYGDVVCED